MTHIAHTCSRHSRHSHIPMRHTMYSDNPIDISSPARSESFLLPVLSLQFKLASFALPPELLACISVEFVPWRRSGSSSLGPYLRPGSPTLPPKCRCDAMTEAMTLYADIPVRYQYPDFQSQATPARAQGNWIHRVQAYPLARLWILVVCMYSRRFV